MKILVVDDEEIQRNLLEGFLRKKGYEVYSASCGKEALQRYAEIPFQLVLLDHRMPDMNGDELLAKIKQMNPLAQAILITAYGSVQTAVSVMKLGAVDFLEKPVDLVCLAEKIQQIEQRMNIEHEAAEVSETINNYELPINIIGQSPSIKEVLSLIRRIAPTPYSVLIRGETGTGKELFARLIHLLSHQSNGAFTEVNCSAIPEHLFESELFGHEKGAFTGASFTRKGRFELASGGTLFLDEIGELPYNLQAKLLRAIQEKQISRIGSEKNISVDIRVIAATNRDLKKMVADGQFREDLYYRLKVFDIELPPLRHRKEDIPLLVDFFLNRYSSKTIRFNSDAMTTLLKYDFPGNVRELEHIIQRTATLCRGSIITANDLPSEIRLRTVTESGTLSEKLMKFEREMIITALDKHGWIQTRAAESLGISERVLRYKMGKYGIQK